MQFISVVVILTLAVSIQAGSLQVGQSVLRDDWNVEDWNGWRGLSGWNGLTGRSAPVRDSVQISPLSYTAQTAPLVRDSPFVSELPLVRAASIIRAAPIIRAASVVPAIYNDISPVHYVRKAHVIVPSEVVPVASEGRYVAANLGAVHTAPLSGHTQSVSSINFEPSPGTW